MKKYFLVVGCLMFTFALNISSSAFANDGQRIMPIVNYLLSHQPAKHYPPGTLFTAIPTETNVAYPAYLDSITGPVFTNKITRLSDSPGIPVNFPYPKTPSWNSDGTLLMLTHLFMNGNTYELIEQNAWWDNDEKKWSAIDPNIYYAMQHNNDEDDDGTNDHSFVKRDVSTTLATGAAPSRELLITFSGAVYEKLLIGSYEGNIDHKDKYVVFSAKKHGTNFLTAIVYDIKLRAIKTTIDLTNVRWVDDQEHQIFDWISVSPSGEYILMNWVDDPNNENSDFRAAIYQYDINMNFIRKLANQGSHGDIGVNAAGQDVYVQFEYGSRRGIWGYDLASGVETKLLPDKYNGGHVSCRNYQRPGWCYVSTTAENYREIFALKLDGSGIVNRFAQTHTTGGSSQGGVNPDGTKMIFSSDWGGATADDIYEAFVVEVEH